MKLVFLFFSAAIFFVHERSVAYPQFIGHGYTSCLTCHYSPTGGGALNDYGRALYAVEISQKPFWLKTVSDEKVAEQSGFLGTVNLPFWIRPGIKYRRLLQTMNPGSTNESRRDIRMQADLNLNFFPDPSQTKGLITTISHLARPESARPNRPISEDYEEFAMREYFWRQPVSKKGWISGGFLDRPYGIKHADHTAVNRNLLPLGINHQVHGIQYSQYDKKTEFHVMPYAGNLHLAGKDQHWGISGTFEYEPVEKIRYGVSLMYEDQNPNEAMKAFSVHSKVGLQDHNAWMIEVGAKNEKEWTPFVFSQMSFLLTRGLYLEPTLQFYQTELTSDGVRRTSAGLGLLYFPFQRVELRAQVINASIEQQKSVGDSVWIVQTQLHLSL